jgi:hypothetical protein
MSSSDFSNKTMAWKWKCGEVTEMTGFSSDAHDHLSEMSVIIKAAKSDHQERFHVSHAEDYRNMMTARIDWLII